MNFVFGQALSQLAAYAPYFFHRQLREQLFFLYFSERVEIEHARHTVALGVPVYKLPSTSPANASWSFERKLAAWREVMALAGLVSG